MIQTILGAIILLIQLLFLQNPDTMENRFCINTLLIE